MLIDFDDVHCRPKFETGNARFPFVSRQVAHL